ncbi:MULTISPECIES: SDR family NAD(P)-dependent oxidoreductase [Amycolatopsis]|uniref:SDR family NAD(P)-dependent oxidoreductase n=1 Tax=Amycolatopsis tucumanensis TaxID=401106 RepID=A0ABP7IU38_9PSEU|nr:SDR family NAD(P)-dependent oxidoreductase [Amycolatopsis tucumanensis]MCF6424645.1 SDR family NAD(P)-dependent oxidoreductase [Amycolatopsis tucumanensis]
MRTLAIFGAGPGMGLAAARRFGKEGYQVSLVARSADRLSSFVDELSAEGVAARAFPADMTDLAAHERLLADIGRVDVAVINGSLDLALLKPVRDLDVETLRSGFESVVLAPLSLTRRLLPGMLERGSGALLYGFGSSAKTPEPMLAGAGTPQAALRNYVFALRADLAGTGVTAAAITIGSLIRGSDAEKLFDASVEARRGFDPDRIDPADLAEMLWGMAATGEPAEQVVPG